MLHLKFIDSQDALGHHPIYKSGDTTYVDCFPFYCTFYTNLDINKFSDGILLKLDFMF